VLGPAEDHGPSVEVELDPRRTRIAVARLSDAPGVQQPFAVADLEALVGAPRLAGGGRSRRAPERQRDVRVADEADTVCLGVEAQLRLQRREHVLPDRVARAGVEQPDLLIEAARLERV